MRTTRRQRLSSSPRSRSGRRSARAILLLAAASILHPPSLTLHPSSFRLHPSSFVHAQESTVRGNAIDLAPGVVAGEATRQSGAGGVYLRTLRVELGGTDHTIPHARLNVVVPGAGIWNGGSLNETLVAQEAHGGIAVLPSGSAPPRGLLFADATLYSWPADGPLVVGNPEGSLTYLANPSSGTARILVNGEAIDIALDSINGAPGESAALYGGPLDPNAPIIAQWPAETEAIILRPSTANTGAHSFWDSSLPNQMRDWQVADRQALGSLRLGNRQWAMVLPPTVDEESRNRIANARALRIEIDLPREIALAAYAFPVSRVLDSTNDDVSPEEVRTLLAMDSRGSRAILAESGGASRGEFAFGAEELTAILGREGTTRLMEMVGSPQEALRMIVRRPDRRVGMAAEAAEGRAFLIVAPGNPVLPAGDGERMERLAISFVHGSNQRQIANTAAALFDGVSGERDDLSHFWAAPIPEDADRTPAMPGAPRPALQWVEWRLLEPARVHALDLIHAEDAGFSPEFNLRAFRVLGRFDNRGAWVELAEVHHEEPLARERVRLSTDRPVESLRLEVLEPNFLPGGETARLVEIIPWGRQ